MASSVSGAAAGGRIVKAVLGVLIFDKSMAASVYVPSGGIKNKSSVFASRGFGKGNRWTLFFGRNRSKKDDRMES